MINSDSESTLKPYLSFLPPPSPLSDFGSIHPSARLPIEIWREIFNFATDIPRGHDSSLSSPFDYSEVHTGHIAFQRHLNAAHKIKQNLRLVSRKIGAVVQELIFEYLFLRDVDGSGSKFNWYALAPGLEESKKKEEKFGRRGAGWYVKRLEIFTHANIPIGMRDEMSCTAYVDKVDAAARILKCCPNVRMLALGMHSPDSIDIDDDEDDGIGVEVAAPAVVVGVDANGFPAVNENVVGEQQQGVNAEHIINNADQVTMNDLIPYPIFNALFHNLNSVGKNMSCNHLRRLEWTSDIVPATNLLFTYLPSLPCLESFYVNIVHSYYPSASVMNLELPKLHTIEILSSEADPSSLLCVLATWKLDGLKKFGLTTSSPMSNPAPFFKAHGSKINIFDFSFLGPLHGPVLLRHCIPLNDMITHLRWAPLHVRRLEHKNVTRIGIRGAHFRDVENLVEDVSLLFGCFSLFLSPLVQVTQEDNEVFTQFFTTTTGLTNTPITTNNEHNATSQSKTTLALSTTPIPPKLRPQHFPSLHTIRLLDFSQSLFKDRKWRSEDVVMWAFWVRRFERLNVRLEDHEGNPIKVVFSQMNVFLPGDEPRWWRYR